MGIRNFLAGIQRKARQASYKKAVREADKIALATGKTMLIYFYEGEFKYISKQDAKKSGLSGAEAEAIACTKIVRYGKQGQKTGKASKTGAKQSNKRAGRQTA